ncbi:MAG TPA: lipopolysaccharide transport periplasmic protein LptA [Alcanivorax sp.]|nr:lipopolysaccharide transport periplasmic protein LptA [Alcanivorax sp.]HAI25640.1 lipopolysaccharide transport periplasmic protein LptA [Alcanivorax sp.]HCI10620.1 lipopolysaccharide transport periplasmic protein LptA [Alcanivorax sp.]HCO63498.1 lipopolysaccharide transport periplasmic protein LptA [Alcanivorax sp.]
MGKALLALALTALTAGAAAQQPTGPVEVSADEATFEQSAGTGVYRGNAELIQGKRRLNADVIRLFTENNELVRVEATGSPVRMVEGKELNARADKLVYDLAQRSLVLTGNARVTHQGNTFEGAKVEYNLDSRRVDASSEGDKRVRLVIPAKNAEQASEDAEPEEQDNGEPAQDAPAAQPDNAETP